jgi:hypothetical protein
MELENIIYKLRLKYYNNLLQSANKSNNLKWLEYCRDKLHIELSDSDDKISEAQNETNDNKDNLSNENLYTKNWIKLNVVHKILKIKEFVNSLKIDSDIERNKIQNILIEMIKMKVLTKKEKVNYDVVSGKIISICDLQFIDGKYHYPNKLN